MKHFNTINVKPIYSTKGEALMNVFAALPCAGDWHETANRKVGEIRVKNLKAFANYWTANGAKRTKEFAHIADAVEFFEHADAEKYASNWFNAKHD